MSIHLKRGYKYGCYSVSAFGFERHQRALAGDFGDVSELRVDRLGNVGFDVGKAGSVGGVRSVQLPFDKDGKEAK